MNSLEKYTICALGFEVGDDITGFLERAQRQVNRGLELSCPYKAGGDCDSRNRFSLTSDSVCDNQYDECEIYKKIVGGRDG